MAALRACGASPDTADQRPPAPRGQKKKFYRESVKDLIDAGLLKPGTMLQSLRKGLMKAALVLPDGSLRVGEQIFTAVSPAAMAVSGNKAEPGWDFWGAPSGEGGYVPLFTLRERLREDGKAVTGNGGTAASQLAAPMLSGPMRSVVAERPGPAEVLKAPAEAPSPKKPRQFSETVSDLLDAGLLLPGDGLYPMRKTLRKVRAKLQPDGCLELNGEVYGSLSASAVAVSGNKAEPGWNFWAVERDGSLISLYELREQLRVSRAKA
jgi:hypothetical protein